MCQMFGQIDHNLPTVNNSRCTTECTNLYTWGLVVQICYGLNVLRAFNSYHHGNRLSCPVTETYGRSRKLFNQLTRTETMDTIYAIFSRICTLAASFYCKKKSNILLVQYITQVIVILWLNENQYGCTNLCTPLLSKFVHVKNVSQKKPLCLTFCLNVFPSGVVSFQVHTQQQVLVERYQQCC